MRPRTKLDVQVLSLSNNLPKITPEQKSWAFKYCLSHIGYRSKKHVACLDCGHIWDGPRKVKKCKCPSCGVTLEIEDTRKKKLDQTNIVMAIIDVVDEFQLVRYFEMYSYHRAGYKASQHIHEVVQQWFVPKGKITIVGKTTFFNNSSLTGDMELRKATNVYGSFKYDIWADKIYPVSRVLPIYKRNGYTSKLTMVAPYTMFNKLLNDNIAETLIKANQHSLFSARVGSRDYQVYKYWSTIKICIRNNYIIKDAISYLDYLEQLTYFKKDVLNPEFACPKNFKRAHNVFIAKRDKIRAREQAERDRQDMERRRIADEKKLLQIEDDQLAYEKQKSTFFGLTFTDGDLVIKFLDHVMQFKEESDAHGHCVFWNEYYKKPDSLVFSAQIKGKRVETVEVSASTLKIQQSRGKGNRATDYNKQIIRLMTKNLPVIKKRMSPIKTKKVQHQTVGAVA